MKVHKNIYEGIAFIILGFISVWLLDRKLSYYIYMHSHAEFYKKIYPIMKAISFLGHYDMLFIISSMVMVSGIYFKPIRPYILSIGLCLVLSDSVVIVLKFLLGKARPELFITKHMYGFYFFKSQRLYSSMPSGHTLLNSALAFITYFKNKKIGDILLIWAVLVGISRIFLLMHYLGDVLVSYGLGILISTLALRLENLYLDSRKNII